MRNKIIYISFLLLLITSCIGNKQEKEAMPYLVEARNLYYTQKYDAAYIVLDSLFQKYPQAYDAKAWAEVLRDSMRRDESRLHIDSLSEEINACKILILQQGNTTNYKEILQNRIDSLEGLKYPFRAIVTEVERKEVKRAAQCQCVTAIKNAKQGL